MVQLPTKLFSADAAFLLRSYFAWAMKNQLEPELYCASCFNGSRDDKAIYNITDLDLQIVCNCQIRAFFGISAKPSPVAASTMLPVSDGETVGRVQLSDDAARLLRQWKKVLLQYGLKEALRCNACFDLREADLDGCRAQVLDSSIVIECRCSVRTHNGMTI